MSILRVSRLLFFLSVVGIAPVALFAEDNWPGLRGADASGVSQGTGYPHRWSVSQNVAWKVKIPGRGWSSPVVWGDKIFLTTVVKEQGELEPIKKGLYFGGNRPVPKVVHSWWTYCLDWNSGNVLWKKLAHQGIPEHGHHLKNTLASETPVVDGERLYVYFGNVGLFCYSHEGEERWSKRSQSVKTRFGWGTAASPVLDGDRLYVINDNQDQSYLEAIDSSTGDQIWRIERNEKSNWATPFVWKNKLRKELITPGSGKVRSYDLSGKLLWEFGGMSSITIATPYSKHGLLYISSGYVLDKKKPLFAIRPGAFGDISLSDEETSNEFIAWCRKKGGPYNPSTIVYGDYLYVLYDRGFIACYDSHTGKEIYGKRRIGPGATAFTSSPWAYEGKLFCLSENGDTFVIQTGPEYKLLNVNPVEEFCMATPAVLRQSVVLRTDSQLYRIESRDKVTAQ